MKKIFPYHWLTAADFTRNGGIKGLQRYGKQASGTYGYVDNLTISYSGNRIAGVSDGAPVVTQNGSMDFPGGSTSSVFSYNAFGALTADPSRGITSIVYDNFGNPVQIQFSNGRNMTNVYSATGEKLKTSTMVGVLTSADPASPFDMEMGLESASSEDTLDTQAVVAQSSVSYHGPIIYRNSTVDKVLIPGGYATISGTAVTFHYYTQDYLGNNRAVINGSTGAIEQTIAYYPFGAVIADLGTPTTGQPYKFGGKELLNTNGLNEYDFGARNYYPAVPGFTKPDQMCEKYYWLSPYLYCANNPVNFVDPTGMEVWGSTKEDAAMAVEDLRAMFPGSDLEKFRDLIVQSGKKQNGKTLAPISDEALNNALENVGLNEDQQALVNIVVDLINSSDNHIVEYLDKNKGLTHKSTKIISERMGLPSDMESSTIASIIFSLCGEGATTPIQDGSLSIIVKDPGSHPLGRPSTFGHEVIGHGRTLKLGFSSPEEQHILSIQVQNLILRNMNSTIQRDGTDHAPLKTFIKSHSKLPILKK